MFGQVLRKHRVAAGLTQEALAERAGVSVHGIQKLEQGVTHPYRDTVQRLLGALQLDAAERAEFEAAATRRQHKAVPAEPVSHGRNNLPAQVTSFVGREVELRAVAQLLEQPLCRLVTLVGPGGTGKTRLGIEAARQHLEAFPDGVYFVPLAPVESARMVASAVGDALNLSLSGPEGPVTQISRFLREKRVLLVLDNFEHLIDATDVLIGLLDTSRVKLLVTSRERLNLQQEFVLDVAGLEERSAVELFGQRARQIQAEFSMTDNRDAVVEICHRLEGMPLALELAATWLRVIPCREIPVQIERSLDFLTSTARNIPARHRSLRAVLDHSWSLLSDNERKVLAHLSVFSGGFELAGADHVGGASLPVLASLVDKSLIQLSASGRYEMHEPLWQYLAEKLAESEEPAAFKNRHLDFYTDLAERAEAHLYGPDQEAWFDRLELEHDNLLAALSWSLSGGSIESGLRLAAALGFFWELRSHWYEANEWLTRLVEHAGDAPLLVRSKVLRFAGAFAEYTGDLPRARRYCEKSLALAQQSGDTWSIAWSLATLGLYVEGSTNTDRAIALLSESLSLFRQIDDGWGKSHTLRRLGINLMLNGEFARARPLLEEALADARRADDKNALAWSLYLVGSVVWNQEGDLKRAISLLEEALALAPLVRDWSNHIWVLFALGAAARQRGDFERAQTCYDEVLWLIHDGQVNVQLNWPELLSGALAGLGGVAVERKSYARAACLFGAASDIREPGPRIFFRVNREADESAARNELGDAAYDAEFAEGKAMSAEQAIAFALYPRAP